MVNTEGFPKTTVNTEGVPKTTVNTEGFPKNTVNTEGFPKSTVNIEVFDTYTHTYITIAQLRKIYQKNNRFGRQVLGVNPYSLDIY